MAGSLTPPHEPSSPVDGGIRKRVCKACDRCRLKKSKCDGSSPCSRCKADNAICFFGERKKSHDKVYPKGYVEMLENQQSQLVSGLQELYRRLQNGQGWTGSPLKETPTGSPLTHDILERLGALKQDGHTTNEAFEENLETLQQKLLASGAGYMQRETSFDNNSEIDTTPVYEHSLPQRSGSLFNGTFSFPPTPPIQSPHPRMVHTSSPLKSQFAVDMTHVSQYQAWPSDIDEMVYMPTTAEPIQDMELDAMAAYAESLYPVEGAINPCLTIKDWQQQQDLSKYYGHNLAV